MGASSTKLEPLKPVDNVPVRQLFGTWFVIAVMPTIFEKGAHNAIETYSDGGKPGAVDIDFRAWSASHAIDASHAIRTGYNKNALDGPLKKLPQTGSSWYDDKTAGWKVSPFWPVKMPYLVIDKSKTALDNDAAWFVVGYPSRAYVWVMARKPEMPRSVLDDIKKRLVTEHQYPEGLPDLVEVPQSWDRDSTAQFGWKRRGVDVSPK